MNDHDDEALRRKMQEDFAARERRNGGNAIRNIKGKLRALGAYDDVLGKNLDPRMMLEAAGPDGQLAAILDSSPGVDIEQAKAILAGKSSGGGMITEDGYHGATTIRPSQADIQTMEATRRALSALDVQTHEASRRLASDYLNGEDNAATRILEAEVTSGESRRARTVVFGSWQVEPRVKTTQSGRDVIKYVAAGPKGKVFQYEFRHKSAASMAAAALNETGGLTDDRRIARIVELCEEETRQLAEYGRHKKLLESVDPANEKRRGNHQNLMENAQAKVKQIRSLIGA